MIKDNGMDYDTLLVQVEKSGLGSNVNNVGEEVVHSLSSGIARVSSEVDFSDEDLSLILDGVKREHASVKHEFDDNASSYNPVALSIASASYLSDASGPLKEWCPVKFLPYNVNDITFQIPYNKISSLVNGKIVDEVNLRDILNSDVASAESKLVPFWTIEETDSFDPLSIRNGTASINVGETVNLYDIVDDKVYNGLELGSTDLIKPGQSIKGINLEVTDGGVVERLRVDSGTAIESSNFFVDGNSGDVNIQDIKTKFTMVLTNTTEHVLTPEGIDGGTIANGGRAVSPLLSGIIPATSVYVVEIEVIGEMNVRSSRTIIKSVLVNVVSKVVSGQTVVIAPGDAIEPIQFKGISFDISGELTNSDKKNPGNIIRDGKEKYPFRTITRTPITKEYPIDARDRNSSDSVNAIVKISSYVNKSRMMKTFVSELQPFFDRLKLSKQANILPKVPNELTFVVTAEEDVHSVTTVDNMNEVDRIKNERSGIEQAIEKMAKTLMSKSKWTEILTTTGIRSSFVRVLVREDANIGDFTMSNGVKVRVSRTSLINDTMWISLEANGGPVVNGVKMYRLATQLVNAPTTFKGRRETNDGLVDSVTTTPSYNTLFTLPIIGKLTLS